MNSRCSRFVPARDLGIVLFIGALGVALALQGWRSRVPGTEVIPYIDGAHSLLAHGRIPDRGVVTSMASYAPPGLAWIVLPGLSLFSDPRLFDAPGIVILHLGTLLGVFLLARLCFGVRCALLAVLLYGLSERGLMFAASLGVGSPGPRGHPFFYVWMAYWVCCWVSRRDHRYLAAALLTWLTGMFVFMEVAPAVFILPVVWALYRPPVRLRSLAAATALAVLMWYPYLRFEAIRGFADIRSQLLLQSLPHANWSDVLCDSTLSMSRWTDLSGWSAAIHDPQPATHAARFAMASGRRVLAVARGLVVNFEGQVPGMELVLLSLTVAGLLVLKAPRASFGRNDRSALCLSFSPRWLTTCAIGLLLLSALANEAVIGHALGSREGMRPDVISTVRTLQIMMALGGIALLMRGSIARAGSRLAMRFNPGSHDADVFVVALVVPWLILLAIAEWGRQPDRLVGLWPLQAIVLAFVCCSIWTGVGSRFARRAGPIVIAGVILANSVSISRVEGWVRDGWAGPDAVEVQIVDYLASRLRSEGRDRAAIGYRKFTVDALAPLTVDPWWKVGAEFDLMLRFQYGISNINECVEGLSAQDEYRVIAAYPPASGDMYYFDVAHSGGLRFIDRIGNYQLYRSD